MTLKSPEEMKKKAEEALKLTKEIIRVKESMSKLVGKLERLFEKISQLENEELDLIIKIIKAKEKKEDAGDLILRTEGLREEINLLIDTGKEIFDREHEEREKYNILVAKRNSLESEVKEYLKKVETN